MINLNNTYTSENTNITFVKQSFNFMINYRLVDLVSYYVVHVFDGIV